MIEIISFKLFCFVLLHQLIHNYVNMSDFYYCKENIDWYFKSVCVMIGHANSDFEMTNRGANFLINFLLAVYFQCVLNCVILYSFYFLLETTY